MNSLIWAPWEFGACGATCQQLDYLIVVFLSNNNFKGECAMAIRVLIADDATFMRTVLRKLLAKNGFEVVGEAENGKQAVAKYSELKPDIVTMDITMPEMDGLHAVKEIKKHHPEAKIIMCSAMGQSALVVEAIQAGAKDFIVKPFVEELVIEKILKNCNV